MTFSSHTGMADNDENISSSIPSIESAGSLYSRCQKDESIIQIASWNVAGLDTTLRCIEKRHGSLNNWILKHQVDILCLQETKLDVSQIGQNRKKFEIDGFDTFWCCNRGTSQRKGLNGVATFVKKGMTSKAIRNVFSDKELDDEGRCLATIHGNIAILNVYTPNSANQARSEYKQKFLRGLTTAIEKFQKQGLEVILLGDLNISPRSLDLHWKRRLLSLPELAEKSDGDKAVTGLFISLVKNISLIEEVFNTRKIVPTAAGKFRAAFQFDSDKGHIAVGSSEFQQEYVGFNYNRLTISELLTVSERLNLYSGSQVEWNQFSDDFGKSKSEPASIAWLNETRKTMLDSYTELFGSGATGRFTCWNQVKNSRYRNEGSRIDFILIEKTLFEKGRCRESNMSHSPSITLYGKQENEAMALSECTAGGQFKPAPITGGGIPEAVDSAYDHQFSSRVSKSVGFIYTPPEYSDHVVVTATFPSPVFELNITLQSDAATKSCQPHKSQPSILSFMVKRKRSVQPTVEKKQKEEREEVVISD